MSEATNEATIADLVIINPDGTIKFDENFTYVTLLDRYGEFNGERPAFRFLDYSGYEEQVQTLSWSQFINRCKAVAARIQQVTERRDRVAVLCRQSLDYVVAFFSAIFAGNIAVPLFEPSEVGHTDRLDAVIRDCNPTLLLTSSDTADEVRKFFRDRPAKERPRVLAVDAVPDDVGMLWWRPEGKSKDVAYLQYTSGSTRIPSGVEITHESIAMNVVQIAEVLQIDEHGAGCQWLPLFHDMGLISMLVPVSLGGSTTIMSPSAFVRRPARWIQALSDVTSDDFIHKVWAAAPNFAYEHAALRGVPKEGQNLDLKKLVLLNGSEPISISTMENFTKVFRPYGFPEHGLKPCYGLAEATLMVSCTPIADKAIIKYVDREELSNGKFVEIDQSAEKAMPQVSCGKVTHFQDVLIVDPETGYEQPDKQIGEIWCAGDNMGKGYWGKTEETEETFHAKLVKPLDKGTHLKWCTQDALWMRTGDLGCYVDGDLYVTGRIKDLIIIAGRNHYPQDIESSAQDASSALRHGYVAAFTVPADTLAKIARERGSFVFDAEDNDVSEQLVIVAERASGIGKLNFDEVKDAIRMSIAARHGITLRDLVLVTAGSIPRTSSGKIAHSVCKSEYISGGILAHSKH